MTKFRAGIVGATGYVGQRFLTLLADHPWFEVTKLAASKRSAGKTYAEATEGRWSIPVPMPEKYAESVLFDSSKVEELCEDLDLVFCAVDMSKDELIALEEAMAKQEVAVISNNSANRWTEDVPTLIPEINPDHTQLIERQRKRLGTRKGFIACKPNCSIQSYTPMLDALKEYEPEKVIVSTYQAISGAGKTFDTWPEMIGNVIPYIGGEEEKSEQEPLRILGKIHEGSIELPAKPVISAQCYRVPVLEGHMASVAVSFAKPPTREQIIDAWKNYQGAEIARDLPSSPKQKITYYEENDRPQTRFDVMTESGMGFMASRLREDPIFDYKFTGLSHNTIRGAAGGAILMAELLTKQGFIEREND